MTDAGAFEALLTRIGANRRPMPHADPPVTDAPPSARPSLAVILGEGGGAPGWARALSGLAERVRWIVPDPDDAKRLQDMLTQQTRREGRHPAFSLHPDPGAARGADLLVITDAAPALVAEIEPYLAPDAALFFAGARTALDALAARVARPERLAGLHLPPPASLTTLAEIMLTEATAPDLRALALALAGQMRRRAVLLPPGGDCPSLALTGRLWEEVDALLLAGTAPWELDETTEEHGWSAPGPCLRQDLAGLDTACALRRQHAARSGRAVAPIAPRMLAEGRLGRRGGVGWYRYPGDGGPVIDPLMADMCAEEAHFAGIEQHEASTAEIIARLTLAVIDEAALLAQTMDKALPDLVAVDVLGFPARSGGPLTLARALGLPAMEAALEALATENPARWADAPSRLALVSGS